MWPNSTDIHLNRHCCHFLNLRAPMCVATVVRCFKAQELDLHTSPGNCSRPTVWEPTHYTRHVSEGRLIPTHWHCPGVSASTCCVQPEGQFLRTPKLRHVSYHHFEVWRCEWVSVGGAQFCTYIDAYKPGCLLFDIDIFVSCNWVATRWQSYSTLLHTSNI